MSEQPPDHTWLIEQLEAHLQPINPNLDVSSEPLPEFLPTDGWLSPAPPTPFEDIVWDEDPPMPDDPRDAASVPLPPSPPYTPSELSEQPPDLTWLIGQLEAHLQPIHLGLPLDPEPVWDILPGDTWLEPGTPPENDEDIVWDQDPRRPDSPRDEPATIEALFAAYSPTPWWEHPRDAASIPLPPSSSYLPSELPWTSPEPLTDVLPGNGWLTPPESTEENDIAWGDGWPDYSTEEDEPLFDPAWFTSPPHPALEAILWGETPLRPDIPRDESTTVSVEAAASIPLPPSPPPLPSSSSPGSEPFPCPPPPSPPPTAGPASTASPPPSNSVAAFLRRHAAPR